MRKKLSKIVFSIAAAMMLTAFGTAGTVKAAELAAAPTEVTIPGMYRSELTNEWIPESLRNQRPIAAMVDNEKIALPHYGISKADVVYEMMNSTKNGRITRLMVLVKDWANVDRLGSIRSLRPTNILLASEWNAVLCHDGGPFYNDAYLAKGYINNFSAGFARIANGKPKEFTEYITTGEVAKRFKKAKLSTQYNEFYPGPHFKFADEMHPVVPVGPGTESCSRVELPFYHNSSTLIYNPTTMTYDYYEYGKAHVDAGNNNKQTTFKNVIIQDCTYTVYDKNGYMIFNCIDIFRPGYYITNGRVTPIVWMKTSDTDITRYFGLDGQEITINTGKTYIALCPNDDFPNLKIYP